MTPTAPLEETVWDLVDKTTEILGFWEQPQLTGYFGALNALHLQTAVRLAEAGTYGLKADLVGPKPPIASGFAGSEEAGIRSLDATTSYPASDGRWEVRTMTLTGGTPRGTVATAQHLGFTDEYLAIFVHPEPEPPPFPSTVGNRIAPPITSRRLPDDIRMTALDKDASGKFAALSVSIPLKNWPPSYCRWEVRLFEGATWMPRP